MGNRRMNSGSNRNEVDDELCSLNANLKPAAGDKTLIALRSGDHQAYHDIYCVYKESIQFFLQRILQSEEEAKELTQEIFVDVWERRHTLDPTKSIKSYLYATARNTAANYFKHLRVIDRYVNHEMYADGLDYNSDDQMTARETQYLIDIAVSRMPAKRKKVFELSRYDNLSNEQIAKKLNMNKLTVASHLSQAVKEIREILALFYALFIM